MKVVLFAASNPETLRVVRAVQRVRPDFEVVGFIDNDPKKKGTRFCGWPVFGGFEVLEQHVGPDVRVVNLHTGSTRVRYETSRHMAERGVRFTNLLHPSVNLDLVTMGTGNYIQEGVVVQAGVTVGDNSSIHIGAMIGHETRIGHSVFIAHACSVSGLVDIGDGVFMGTNATVVPRVRIGRWATIGAGSVVIKDVPDHATVVGNPGKVIKVDPSPPHADGDVFKGLRSAT
jgi:sugar O-acyltransferase (sialic acid O-acetyltransferase NeuD family)